MVSNVKKTYFHDIAVDKSNGALAHNLDHRGNCGEYGYKLNGPRRPHLEQV